MRVWGGYMTSKDGSVPVGLNCCKTTAAVGRSFGVSVQQEDMLSQRQSGIPLLDSERKGWPPLVMATIIWKSVLPSKGIDSVHIYQQILASSLRSRAQCAGRPQTCHKNCPKEYMSLSVVWWTEFFPVSWGSIISGAMHLVAPGTDDIAALIGVLSAKLAKPKSAKRTWRRLSTSTLP